MHERTFPESAKPAEHARPFVHDDDKTRSLHFSLCELQSRMRLQNPDALDVEYTRAMMGFLLFNSRPQSIAMIGLGGGSLAKFCYRHLPDTRITVVEINPHVIALRDEFKVPPDDRRFRVVEADGVHFAAHTDQRFDVLLVDGFDDAGMPDGLGTQAFYDDCFQMLSPQGLMAVNLHTEHPDYRLFVGRIERSFNFSVLTVNVKREGNAIVFASRGQIAEQRRHGVMRHPERLAPEAWTELRPTFAQIVASLV
jgi:spermidine synthase